MSESEGEEACLLMPSGECRLRRGFNTGAQASVEALLTQTG